MGQSSSRNEANSQDERPRSTRTSSWRSSALFGQRPDQGPPSRARRYSSNIVDALLQRSNTDATAMGTATATDEPPASVLRRRSRFSRAASSLSMTARSVVRDPFATSNQEALPRSSGFEITPAAVSRPLTPRPLTPVPPQPVQHLDVTSAATVPQRPRSPRSDSSRPQSPRPHRLPGPPSPSGVYPTSRFGSSRTNRTGIMDGVPSPLPHRDFRQSLHFPSFRRRRSPALPASGSDTDSNAVLSRLLSIAAAATAATLMGVSPDAAINDLRNAGGEIDGEDGTFSGFLQALRSGRLTGFGHGQGNRNQDDAAASADTAPQALEFFRMFRFGSINNTRQRPAERTISPNITSGTGVDQPTTEAETNPDQGAEQRMVPVLIVGIRAFNGETDALHDNGEAIPSFLNAMTGVPREFGTETAEAIDRLRRARRRATLGGVNLSNTQDTMRNMHSYRRPRSIDGLPDHLNSARNTPPSETLDPTNARENARERLRMHRNLRPRSIMDGLPEHSGTASLSVSGDTLPTYHGTSDSNLAEPASSRARPRRTPQRSRSLLRRLINEGFNEHSSDEDDMDVNPRPTRRRRLSDSDTPRHGSGSPRRNGVLVEPAEEPAEGSTGETRSWIIYILGGSYPEGHPILSTPSLFSDSPTYEDMLRLSSMLGPVKPPVANVSDVDAAGGVLKVKIVDGMIQALNIEGERQITISDERCLVCLCDYEDKDEVRQLHKCSHVFHRECIDQWLTTGRNSCPLCRGQGVVERPIQTTEAAETAEAGPSTSVSDVAFSQADLAGI